MLSAQEQSIKEDNLLQQIVAGDQLAFNRMYQQTSKNVYNAVMAYVKNEHMTIELVQQTYIKLWNNRQKLKEVRSLEDYLFIIARNLTLDHFKKVTIETKFRSGLKLQETEPVDTTYERMEQVAYEQLLREALMKLPPQQREAWVLANEEELSYAEIADKMNISKLTVKRHLEIGRKKLREYFKAHLHEIMVLPVFFMHYLK